VSSAIASPARGCDIEATHPCSIPFRAQVPRSNRMATIDKFCATGLFDPATYGQGIKVTQAQTILFLSGQVAYTPEGGVACRGDFKGQARGAYEAIKALVESQGGTMANIIKITT
jgi:enamine deaminase RidA (YjgF/YER057c/UK114 family)